MTVLFARHLPKCNCRVWKAPRKMTLFALNVASYMLTLGAYGSAVMGATDGLISSAPTLKRRKFQNFIIATTVLVDTNA